MGIYAIIQQAVGLKGVTCTQELFGVELALHEGLLLLMLWSMTSQKDYAYKYVILFATSPSFIIYHSLRNRHKMGALTINNRQDTKY